MREILVKDNRFIEKFAPKQGQAVQKLQIATFWDPHN